MIFIFFILFLYTLDDISISIWSGSGCEDRMIALCQTWAHQFPKITIYSNKFKQEIAEKLKKLAFPTKLNLIELNHCPEHRITLQNWVKAQPRIIRAMEHTFLNYTEYKWHFFCDDDSFPIARYILEIVNKFNHTDSKVIGYFRTTSQVTNQFIHKLFLDDTLNYAKGGSGVIVSNAYAKRITPFIPNCNKKYSKPSQWASYRFARCSYDHFPEEWVHGRIIQCEERMHPWEALFHIQENEVFEKPAVFHKMTPSLTKEFFWAIRSEWKRSSDNRTLFTDWTPWLLNSYNFYAGDSMQELTLRFPYCIQVDKDHGVISVATSQMEPIFDELDYNHENPISYIQKYGKSIEIIYDCTNQEIDFLEFNKYENSDKLRLYLYMKCPKPQLFEW